MAQENPHAVRVYAFAVADGNQAIKRFLQKINMTLPDNFIIAQDVDKNISSALFQTTQLPETYILRPNHTVYKRIIGAQEQWNSDKWRQEIQILQEQPVHNSVEN